MVVHSGVVGGVKQASLPTILNVQANSRMIKDGRTSELKVFFKILTASIAIGAASLSFADNYDRKDFNYRSYKPNTSLGFYTNKACDFINIDHIVSLKDAYESGAASWSDSEQG